MIDRRTVLASSGLLLVESAARAATKKIYGSTEDVRFMAIVEAMLQQKLTQVGATATASRGSVIVAFGIAIDGSLAMQEILQRSGRLELDKLVLRTVVEASPFPRPPHVFERGLVWHVDFDDKEPPKMRLQLRRL